MDNNAHNLCILVTPDPKQIDKGKTTTIAAEMLPKYPHTNKAPLSCQRLRCLKTLRGKPFNPAVFPHPSSFSRRFCFHHIHIRPTSPFTSAQLHSSPLTSAPYLDGCHPYSCRPCCLPCWLLAAPACLLSSCTYACFGCSTGDDVAEGKCCISSSTWRRGKLLASFPLLRALRNSLNSRIETAEHQISVCLLCRVLVYQSLVLLLRQWNTYTTTTATPTTIQLNVHVIPVQAFMFAWKTKPATPDQKRTSRIARIMCAL